MHIKQGTPEWLELRRSRIGASDAATCAGLNPYKTVQKLYEEKVNGVEPYITSAMQRGTDLEPCARASYEEITGNAMFPDVKFHPDYDWMMASLDGISMDESKAVEIKCPGEKNHLLAISGIIPVHYQCQMIHQMLVLGLKEIDFFSYHPDFDPVLMKYSFDEELADKILEAEKEFYECLRTRTPPKGKNEPLTELGADDEQLLRNLRESVKLLNTLKEKTDLLKKEAIERFQKPIKYDGISIEKVFQKGRVDYNSIPELSQVNLDAYRNEGAYSWRVRAN